MTETADGLRLYPDREVIEALGDLEEMRLEAGGLARAVTIEPEVDCWEGCAYGKQTCSPHTGGWHGVRSRQVRWSVSLPGRGGVDACLSTPIYTERAVRRGARSPEGLWNPIGALSLHSAAEREGWQQTVFKDKDPCHITGEVCWSTVTYLQSETLYETFLRGGSQAVWAWLGEAWLPGAIS